MNKIWFDGNAALDIENTTCEQELKSFCFEVIEPDNLHDIQTCDDTTNSNPSIGKLTNITEITGTTNQSFMYDGLNRLTLAMSPGAYGAKYYEYDSVGNMIYNPDSQSANDSFDFEGSLSGGTINGASYSAGRLGQGLLFDGNDSVTIPNYASPSKGITIELWVRQTNGGSIIKKDSSYELSCDSSGLVNAWLSINNTRQTISAQGLDNNIWKHIALTYDGSAIKLYINASLVSSLNAVGNISSNANPITLGTSFTGRLDEINIFGRALTINEITSKYSSIPNIAPNQPSTPEPIPSTLYTGRSDTLYTFKFKAWDTNNDNVKYRINWGDLEQGSTNYSETGCVANGTEVEATHSWNAA